MDCKNIQDQMPVFLTGGLSEQDSALIQEHLMRCEACQKELEVYKLSWNSLKDWEDEEPDPAYIARFWNRLAQKKTWHEQLIGPLVTAWADKRLVPVFVSLFLIVFVGSATMRYAWQVHQEEALVTALSAEEIDFIQNIELVEQLEVLEDMDMFEDMDVLKEFAVPEAKT
ncbi:MAG TPA: zf-HC2 domain-containing protein [Candidatus Omnitrophota bacterium]|jgi:hypothetical protein|nr:zf-HC2 domain-containing protein [Candidatus Omnitrophota bacterium]HSA31544.1 zf-HC2 domain-containing protein [Candidatus Omnitrophota bacterium]